MIKRKSKKKKDKQTFVIRKKVVECKTFKADDIVELKKIVKALNNLFDRNFFSKKFIQPFEALFTKDGWFITCDNLYILHDDKRFKKLKEYYMTKYKGSTEFSFKFQPEVYWKDIKFRIK
jgi:hypothetical protein